MNNLKAVLQNLKSDKIKERQEGLSLIRTIFAQDSVVDNFYINRDGVGDPRAWLSVFQALFQAVLNEKLAVTKKTAKKTATSIVTAQKRLGDAASAVRWLTERTVHLMNKRVIRALIDHLLQIIVHNGEFLAPVALDYIMTLRCIVSFTPHLEQIDDDTWVKIVEMGFNTVLGDPIKANFEDDTAHASPILETDDSDLFVDNDSMNEDPTDSDAILSTSKKRRRSGLDSTLGPSSSKPASYHSKTVQHNSVSLEQVGFMSILSILLRSYSSPILSTEYPYLASSILLRLQRFLSMYSAETSLLHDYIVTLSATISHLSLNKVHDVREFTRASWDGLVGLWGTKNKSIKEGLIAILHVLFPFLTSDRDLHRSSTPFDCAASIGKLSYLLNGEVENRWGIDGLSLDSLRLELANSQTYQDLGSNRASAFVARTFRSGWSFDTNQALAWATLELQADCIGKLFQLSESVHPSSTPGPTLSKGKRIRLENPVTSLLTLLQRQPASNVRSYHLQTLLFFIDRHWTILHSALQQEISQTLLQFVSLDDSLVQSWVFLCFAAIAYASASAPASISDVHSSSYQMEDGTLWDSIWTNAIRRVNVPTVCRAACHAAYVILIHTDRENNGFARIPLASQRVLIEIEAIAKDLDVQGPPYPYDSVCTFLACCLKVASQDIRLYRMQLEEKALSWLVDCWKIVGVQKKALSLYMVNDLMLLLENICGLAIRSDLISRVPLPNCQIVETLAEEAKTKVIRDFLLTARLPTFYPPKETKKTGLWQPLGQVKTPATSEAAAVTYLSQPRGRERRVSTFLLKSLEQLSSEWEEYTGYPTTEVARRSLDSAVIALSFESALVLNGIQSNRRLLQCACKLIGMVTTILTDARWTPAEKALISLGLDPLICTRREHDDEPWDAMLLPDVGSGIRSQNLSRLTFCRTEGHDNSQASRMKLLRIVWQNTDVQNVFNNVTDTLRDVLRVLLGDKASSVESQGTNIDKDGFGPIRTVITQQSQETDQGIEDPYSCQLISDVCMAFLTVGPTLQSASGEPTRDKYLTDLVLSCAEPRPEIFLLIFPIILEKNRQRSLSLSVKNIDNSLDELSRLLQLYAYARSKRLQLLVVQLLDSTLDVWVSSSITGETLGKIRQLCKWLSGALRMNKIKSWAVRDSLARLLDRYLIKDPMESAWSATEADDPDEMEGLPSALLPIMGADDDMRVRFRVAAINGRLFALARRVRRSALDMYNAIKKWYTVDIDNYERMLTRMLSLGNIMIISSAVRRGPYWHLLETCIHSPLYSDHIESILHGVSQRMGLMKPSELFESYASQLAYSIRQADSDLLRFPPHLLGYRDRLECAEATFRLFTPTNIWNGGQKLFEGHCRVISKTTSEGLRECFGDTIAYQIATWIDEHDTNIDALSSLLETMTFHGDDFQNALAQNLDGIIASILRTLGDQDFADNGPIVKALHRIDQTGQVVRNFRGLMCYRKVEDFDTHEPNLPAFPTETILRSLDWLRSRALNVDAKATTYHVLHQLFADVEQAPLVNEQIRLINAISLWVALHHRDFEEMTLLYTLIHGAITLLGQSDLARSSQSILDWSFGYYRKGKTKHPRIPDILVRVCCLAHEHTLTVNTGLPSMGNELLQWIDSQVLKLFRVPALSSQVTGALPAWPHQPSPELVQLYESITSESLSAVLKDHRIASSKFRVVHRLRDHAISKDYDQDYFAKFDFWRLKECIPSTEQLQDADVDAFTDLLFLNKGHLDSFHSESSNAASILSHYKRDPKNLKNHDKAKESIVFTLLVILQGGSAPRSYMAYQTLRLIKSASAEDRGSINLSLSEHLIELQYLETYQRSPQIQSCCDLRELMTESYFDSIKDFPTWIAKFTTLLSNVLSANDPFYAQLTPILQTDTEFAEQVLPVLIHTLLCVETTLAGTQDSSYRTLLSEYFTTALSIGTATIPCIRSIIDAVLHLRYFAFKGASLTSSFGVLSYNKWLDIDFMLLAQSAITCGAYTTALLFLELATDHRKESPVKTAPPETILYEIYRHIDEPDGFYGIHDEDLRQNLMKRFHHERQWERAFRFHGAALEAGSTGTDHVEGLVKSFHSFGFDHLANSMLQNPSPPMRTAGTSSTLSYRLAWRTETWDLPDCNEKSTGTSLYLALRAIHRERDSQTIDDIIRLGLTKEMNRLRILGAENFAEIREIVQDLMCLREIMKWRRGPIQHDLTSKHICTRDWEGLVEMDPDFDFSNLENIMATRISLIRSARQKEERQQIGTLITPFAQNLIDIEKRCLVRLSKAARTANHVQIALNSVVRAQTLEMVPSFAVFEEFASVLWCQNEKKFAVEFLDRLRYDDRKQYTYDTMNTIQKALLLARLGTWSSEACLKKPTDIQKEYFKMATDLLHERDASDMQIAYATVYHKYAIFAERQYHAIIKSPDAIRWKVYVDRKQQEIESRDQELLQLQSGSDAYKFLQRNQKKARILLQEDSELFRAHNSARDTFLNQAIEMYSRCLQASDFFDSDAAIRLCSLWFANFEDNETGLQEEVSIALDRIPSRKLIFLAYQLSARISKFPTGKVPKNQENLQNLVCRMCYEHPFHSLYQVYCLQPDQSATPPTRRHSNQAFSPSTQTERSAAAGDIFDRLRADEMSRTRVRDIEHLCNAYMEWAKYPIKNNQKFRKHQDFKLPSGTLISKITNLRVPVTTHHTPVDPTMRYDNCPWIDHYDSTFTTAGGNGLPKINNCFGTDGIKYKQLFKGEGEDDLRQDAVMEQVFELVNSVLNRDRETRRRLLSVRDYKIITLGSQAGLLEFVGNTFPLQRWLLSAHVRYHPDDMQHSMVCAAISKAQAEHATSLDKLVEAFEQLKKKFRPVMRHYFTEKHKTPISWFAMRLSYTRSVATTSIVGHVLGLGDRHISNILLDSVTGQVVHIDLGIAFDQGKLLPVPELVPFRMTRDMVDGMGMSGTSGVFHRCAEETLRVLRDDSEVIMTVLEVFKYDPLHSWTASEVKVKRIQEGVPAGMTSTSRVSTGIGIDMNSGTAEEAADRALSSVARKLDKSLSVEYTVNQLIRDATDSRNLARIYQGWSALC